MADPYLERSNDEAPVGPGNTPLAADQLLPLVYEELRRLAATAMARERPGQTLDATALVHEAYLRLVGPGGEANFDNHRHFFAAAATAMRRILVEKARRKKTTRHGGVFQRQELGDLQAPTPDDAQDLLEFHDALLVLEQEDPLAARVVELRHFAGLGHEATARALETSVYRVRQKWTYARAWLRQRLNR